MNLRQQKYLIISLITSANFALIYTFIIFHNKWYAYLCILILSSLLNAFSSILNIVYRMFFQPSEQDNLHRLITRSYLYVVPCYNESESELRGSIHSLIEQRHVHGDNRLILIICDGKVKGAGNALSTDALLKDLLQISGMGFYYEYPTWDGKQNIICEYKTMYTYKTETMPIILLIKENNYGKRDSLVLARRLCYAFNRFQGFHNSAQTYGIDNPDAFLPNLVANLAVVFPAKIDYIIGIDADTLFDYNCTYELIQGIERDKDGNIHGCVGFVDVDKQMPAYSPFVLYQYAEYVFAQTLRRQAQANITHKVSCLSGCNQILRVSEETCGEKILKVFNYYPTPSDNIFKHIRSYASEDRNHVCNMLSLYPYVRTTQTLKAVAYTVVPTSIRVFLSQRRRWNLGANTNDLLLIYLPGINIFERILAGVNVLTFTLTPFICVATVYFVMAIITEPTTLMLYLSIVLFPPIFHSFLVPLFIKPLSFKDSLYYYLAYLFFLSSAWFVSVICFVNALIKIDVFTWGKTRMIACEAVACANVVVAVDEVTADEVVNSYEVVASEVEASEVEASEVDTCAYEVVEAIDTNKLDLSYFIYDTDL